MRFIVFACGLVAAALFASKAPAAVIVEHDFNTAVTSGSNATSFSNGGDFGGNRFLWDNFTLSSAASISSASFLLQDFNGVSTSYGFEIAPNNGGIPGASIYSITLLPSQVTRTENYSANMERFDFALPLPVNLSAGDYWVTFNGTNLAGGFPLAGSSLLHENENMPPQYPIAAGYTVPFQLSGTFAVEAVPEPASLVLWGLGALGCTVAGYRRRKRSV
jgi:hypothetical protein